MYLLAEIATAQPVFQSHFCAPRAQTLIHGKLPSIPCRFSSAWKSLGLSKELNFDLRHLEVRRGRLLIKAVATLEPKGLVQNKNGQKGCDVPPVANSSSFPTIELESSNEDSNELCERERLRRLRISKANKGNTPWNKGRKHSAGNHIFIVLSFCVYQSASMIVFYKYFQSPLYVQKPFNGSEREQSLQCRILR